jgi:hypothetical protein
MKKLLVMLLLIPGHLQVHSQSKQLVVTDFYWNELLSAFGPDEVPDFFDHYPELTEHVRATLDSLIKLKYDASTIYLRNLPEMIYGDSLLEEGNMWGYNETLRKKSKKRSEDYFLRIRSYIAPALFPIDNPPIELGLELRIVDGDGKKVKDKEVVVPFHLHADQGSIYGSHILSSQDFFHLFNKGIRLLFGSKEDNLPLDLIRPTNNEHEDFIDNSFRYELQWPNNKKVVLKQQDSTVSKAHIKRGWPGETKVDGVFKDKTTHSQRITITNPFLQEEWKIRIKASNKELLNVIDLGTETEAKIVEPDDLGNFKIISSTNLSANLRGKAYDLVYRFNSSLTSVYIDGELLLLCQPTEVFNDESPVDQVFIHKEHLDKIHELINILVFAEEASVLMDSAEYSD